MLTDCLSIGGNGHLYISGCDTVDLASQYGTPLYVMSEDKIRSVCRSYIESIRQYYSGYGTPIYASKAFCCKEIHRIVVSEGLDVEVVSGGELYTALEAGVDPAKIHFQGNNKTPGELALAVENRMGDIVADNLTDLRKINEASRAHNTVSNITLRITPGIDAHTHEFIKTGQIDSKFGLTLLTGEARSAVSTALSYGNVSLKGLHCHIGSQILDPRPFVHAAEVMLDFYAQIKEDFGVELETLNLGGGFGIHYTDHDDAQPYGKYMELVSEAVHGSCDRLGLKMPRILLEPGRSIVGEAGITLYTVGNIKEIPKVRNYIAIDGGMYENPRYALYHAEYTCMIANKANDPVDYTATISGKCCESGDFIQEHTPIQKPVEGDILAVLSTGAYNYSMSSNYNRNVKPACVMVSKGASRLIIKPETYEDLLRNDV